MFHWINMIAITLLILTGFYIHSPHSFPLFANMDNARLLHFCMAYILIFSMIGRVYYAFATGDYKNVVFDVKTDMKKLPSMLRYYLFMSDTHPYYGKYNPGQKGMYTGIFFLVLIQAITGFTLYDPNRFMGLAGFLGGYIVVRIIHYIVTWMFILCVMAHLYLDISEGIPVLLSMFTGKLPADWEEGTREEGVEINTDNKGIGA